MAARIDNQEVISVGACEKGKLMGAIFFTRLRFKESVEAYMLSPVAVSTVHQGKGAVRQPIRFNRNAPRGGCGNSGNCGTYALFLRAPYFGVESFGYPVGLRELPHAHHGFDPRPQGRSQGFGWVESPRPGAIHEFHTGVGYQRLHQSGLIKARYVID